MSKQEKKAALPALRFPEFQSSGEWESLPLSEFVETLDAGVSVNSGDRPAMKNEVGILKTSCVTNGVFEPTENKVVSAEKEIERLKEPVCGDTIIISRMNTPALVGANAYIEASKENLFLPDRLWAAKPKRDASMRFIASILGSGRARSLLSEMATGTSGTMKNITKTDVLALQVMAPSPTEQQRIAACLTSIDGLIAAQTQKLDTLKAHKKGLMQQLFPAQGETQPKLRFPEFQGADPWINKQLCKVADVNASGDLDSENFSPTKTDEHIYPIYSNSVTQDGLYGYCTYPKYRKDSVTITARGTLGVAFYRDHDYVGIGRLLILSNLKNSVPYFLQEIWNYSAKMPLENGGIPQLTAIKARAVELYMPEKEEQQKIAACLTSIDGLIATQTQKIGALKSHKKGLMQQLFPAMDDDCIDTKAEVDA